MILISSMFFFFIIKIKISHMHLYRVRWIYWNVIDKRISFTQKPSIRLQDWARRYLVVFQRAIHEIELKYRDWWQMTNVHIAHLSRRVQTTFAVEVRRSTDEKLRDTLSLLRQRSTTIYVCVCVLNIIHLNDLYLY